MNSQTKFFFFSISTSFVPLFPLSCPLCTCYLCIGIHQVHECDAIHYMDPLSSWITFNWIQSIILFTFHLSSSSSSTRLSHFTVESIRFSVRAFPLCDDALVECIFFCNMRFCHPQIFIVEWWHRSTEPERESEREIKRNKSYRAFVRIKHDWLSMKRKRWNSSSMAYNRFHPSNHKHIDLISIDSTCRSTSTSQFRLFLYSHFSVVCCGRYWCR